MAVSEMHRQAGDLMINSEGIAERGLLIRHLVMPGEIAGTGHIMDFLSKKVSPDTYVNIMAQYRPCGRAFKHPIINRGINQIEYNKALVEARKAGITRFDF